MNTQAPTPRPKGVLLYVHSMFRTIQGEGPFTGHPALFVRLAGCNLQCPRCDTEYSLPAGAQALRPSDVAGQVVVQRRAFAGDLVVITGGEPFHQPGLTWLVDLLVQMGYRVQIETNGTTFVDVENEPKYLSPRVTIVCSPKTGRIPTRMWRHIDALKYVVDADSQDETDGLPIEALGNRLPAHVRVARPDRLHWDKPQSAIYIQPMDAGAANRIHNERNRQAAISASLKHGYTLCVQTHKLLGLP